jgi:hypothetical protein
VKPRCQLPSCGAPLSWRKRSDAVYCSAACRVNDYRRRRRQVLHEILDGTYQFESLGEEQVRRLFSLTATWDALWEERQDILRNGGKLQKVTRELDNLAREIQDVSYRYATWPETMQEWIFHASPDPRWRWYR